MICASLLSFKSCSLCTPPGWQANTIRREAQRPENRVRRFPVERCRRQKGCISNAPADAVCLFSIARKGGFMVLLAYQPTSTLAHYRGFIKTGAEGAHHHPLNPLNPLNLLNPHAQRACPKKRPPPPSEPSEPSEPSDPKCPSILRTFSSPMTRSC